jgi:hypothetical protein
MTDAPLHPTESSEPYPPRFRWLWRISAVYVLLIGAVVGVRVWWGNVAGARLDAVVHGAHARGEKILVADYARDVPLPDEQNAAFFLQRAHRGLPPSTSRTEHWALDNASDLPVREDIAALVGPVLSSRQPVLDDIRTARHLPQADWGNRVTSPVWSMLLPNLNHARGIANFANSAAMYAAHRGDHAAAIEHVRDIHGITRALEQDNVFLVTHLVCIGVDAVAADAAADLARDLQIEGTPAPATAPVAKPATRAQVQALIAELLDESGRRGSQRNAFQLERTAQIDIGATVGRRAHIVRPAIQMDLLDLAKEGDQMMVAGDAANWPAAQKLLPVPPKVDGPRVAAHVVSQSVRPALGRAVSTTFRGMANARMAAVALSIRLYQLDHNGQRPPTLAALVPTYLPAVPLDPFAAGGQPLGYIADPVAPYVYSVGENGKDDSALTPPWRPDATTVTASKAPDLFVNLTRVNAPPPEYTDPPEAEPEPTTAPASQ